MKKSFAKSFIIRVISFATLFSLCIIELLRGQFSAEAMCANLIAASSLLLYQPLSFELVRKSLPFVAGQSVFFLITAFSPYFRGNECFMILLAYIPGFVLYTIMRTVEKFSNVKVLFRVDAIWCAVEDYSRLMYVLILGLLSFSALTSCRYEAPAWVFIPHIFLFVVYYGLCYLRAFGNSTFLVGYSREKTIKRIIQGNMRSVPEYGGPDDHMNNVYSKVLRYMENKKPYLDDTFNIDELAEAVFTNKVYLSKAINYYSGRNFRQFINYYRINYATTLMKNDRHLRVTELALRCGFHSVVSFNMAFKLYMNMTPSGYYALLASQEQAGAKA